MERTGDEQNTASLRWVALRQEGPGAVLQGKECRALTISDSETEIEEGVGELGTGGGADCGCLDSIAFSTSVVEWAMPAEERYWMALRYWPSSTARRARRTCCGLGTEEGVLDGEFGCGRARR